MADVRRGPRGTPTHSPVPSYGRTRTVLVNNPRAGVSVSDGLLSVPLGDRTSLSGCRRFSSTVGTDLPRRQTDGDTDSTDPQKEPRVGKTGVTQSTKDKGVNGTNLDRRPARPG